MIRYGNARVAIRDMLVELKCNSFFTFINNTNFVFQIKSCAALLLFFFGDYFFSNIYVAGWSGVLRNSVVFYWKFT